MGNLVSGRTPSQEKHMRKLIVFNNISLDGYFTDAKGDMSWAHEGGDDPEFAAFTSDNAKGGGVLVFGRVTYDLMASFWPTPAAAAQMPQVAEQMNKLEKIVFSRTLEAAAWMNTRLVTSDPVAEMRRIKREEGSDMVIMGSGSIVAQFAQAGLIDGYQVVVCPIALGSGRTMFEGVTRPIRMKLTHSRTFRNGKIFASCEPV
jgi:dihydrofolate reductase